MEKEIYLGKAFGRDIKRENQQNKAPRQRKPSNLCSGDYKIGLYDEEGRRRTLLEQLFILAIVIIDNEIPDYMLPASSLRQVKADSREVIDELVSACRQVRGSTIETYEDLEREINNTGKAISVLKKKIQNTDTVLEHLLENEDLDPNRQQHLTNLRQRLQIELDDKSAEYAKLKKLKYQYDIAEKLRADYERSVSLEKEIGRSEPRNAARNIDRLTVM